MAKLTCNESSATILVSEAEEETWSIEAYTDTFRLNRSQGIGNDSISMTPYTSSKNVTMIGKIRVLYDGIYGRGADSIDLSVSTFRVSPTSLVFTSKGEIKYVSVTSNEDWGLVKNGKLVESITDDEDITIEKISSTSIKVTCISDEEFNVTFYVKSGTETISINAKFDNDTSCEYQGLTVKNDCRINRLEADVDKSSVLGNDFNIIVW